MSAITEWSINADVLGIYFHMVFQMRSLCLRRITLNFRGKAKNKYIFPTQDNSFIFLALGSRMCTSFGACLFVLLFFVVLFCLYFFKHLYWSIIALQWCVSFCFITKWISCTYTCIPISPPSCVSLPPSLSHRSMWTQSTELISPCYAAASH